MSDLDLETDLDTEAFFLSNNEDKAELKKATITKKQQQILHQQKLDEETPVFILRDFQILLDFVKDRDIDLTKTHHLLTAKYFEELNQKLSYPSQIALKKTQIQSYPYIHGLYFLLRISGLSKVVFSRKKPKLILNEKLLADWEQLNLTERYFTLLESWLIWSNSAIIGQSLNCQNILCVCLIFWQRIPKEGLKFKNYQIQQNHLASFPGVYNVVLLHLFGFLTIKTGKTEKGKGWRCLSIKKSDFGEAMLRLLASHIDEILDVKQETARIKIDRFQIVVDKLQKFFQPFFPQWRQKLVLYAPKFTKSVCIFQVYMREKYERHDIPDLWREIAISSECSFDDLAKIILTAFNFDREHLYLFDYQNSLGIYLTIFHPHLNKSLSTNSLKLGNLDINSSTKLKFSYDVHAWEFNLFFKTVQPFDNEFKEPQILNSYGEAPKQYEEDDEDWEDEDWDCEDWEDDDSNFDDC